MIMTTKLPIVFVSQQQLCRISSSSLSVSMFLFHFLFFLVIFSSPSIVVSLSSSSSSSSLNGSNPQQQHHQQKNIQTQQQQQRQIRYQRPNVFKFAPNGVCIQPSYFVELSKNEKQQTHQQQQTQYQQTQYQQQQTQLQQRLFTMRNVPGEGDCMFLAVALAAATSMGLGGNDALLRAISRETREVVAQVLGKSLPGTTLHIEGKRIVSAQDLLLSACRQENLTPKEYLKALRTEGRDGGLYGGGPELTVLANVLRRPISIYELAPIIPPPETTSVPEAAEAASVSVPPPPPSPPSSTLAGTVPTTENDNNNNNVTSDIIKTNLVEEKKKEREEIVACPIICKGSFGKGLFEDPCATIPNSAVLSGIQPGAYSWELHILILDMANGEKHACVLLPETPVVAATTVRTTATTEIN